MGKPVKRPEQSLSERAFLPEVAKGLTLTASRFFKNTFSSAEKGDIATVRYPEEQREYPERFRGVHRLTQRDDGSPRCVACLCCSTACPAQCIHIEPAEYGEGDPRQGYEKFPKVFVIDELRCIFCGMCVEACPCDAIRMDTGMHMPPALERDAFLLDKELLLSLPAADGSVKSANPRHEPGDKTHPGIDRDRSGH